MTPWYLIVRPLGQTSTRQLQPLPTESVTTWLATDPPVDEMFNAAVKFDQRGDWADAIAVFDRIAEKLEGQQDGEYARNCAQRVREKLSRDAY